MAGRPDGLLMIHTGASRSGKSALAMQETADFARLGVWDSDGEWARRGQVEPVRSSRDLLERCRRAPRGRLRIGYCAPLSHFGFFCKVMWTWTRAWPAAIVAEELADVTSPGKAPEEWGLLVRRGLKYGTWIYAITQRPSESDKTIMGNWSKIRCFRMAREADERYMAAETRSAQALLAKLERLQYLEALADRTLTLRTLKLPGADS